MIKYFYNLCFFVFCALVGALSFIESASANTYTCPPMLRTNGNVPPTWTVAGCNATPGCVVVVPDSAVTCTGANSCDCTCPTFVATVTCPPGVSIDCPTESFCRCMPGQVSNVPACVPQPPPPPPPPPAGELCNPYGVSFVPTGQVNVYPDDGPSCAVSGPPGSYSYPQPRPPNKVLKQKPGCDPAQCGCTDACPPGMPPPPTPTTCSTEPGPDCCSYYEYNCNEGGDCGDCAYASNPYIMTDSSPVRCKPGTTTPIVRECATYCVTCESPCMQECEAKVCDSLDPDTYQSCKQASHAAAAECISKCAPNWCRFLDEKPCCEPEPFDPYAVCMGGGSGGGSGSGSGSSSGTTPTP
jgi:hypothetical protein